MRRTRFDERRSAGWKRPLIIAAIVIAVLFLWYKRALGAPDVGSDKRIPVTIEAGSSTAAIADILEEAGVIRSSTAFKWHVRLNGKAAALQAGSFVFTPSLTVAEVIERLTSSEKGESSVTIPEGYTVFDIDKLLAEKGLIEAGEFAECALTCDFSSFEFLPKRTDLATRRGQVEGSLYPETYLVDPSNFIPKFFMERLLGTFRSKVLTPMESELQSSKRSLHEVITMASLIEEETRRSDERGIVSGILWKRIDEGMGLYVDATTRYIAEKPTAVLTVNDLAVDSPYNTRKYRGLPPGPIASPSLSSIRAALEPESSPYYYYLHGSDGQIRYATTNDEHNMNKAKYL